MQFRLSKQNSPTEENSNLNVNAQNRPEPARFATGFEFEFRRPENDKWKPEVGIWCIQAEDFREVRTFFSRFFSTCYA